MMPRGASQPRVYLAPPTLAQQEEFLGCVAASRGLHHPFVQPPSTEATFASYLERTTRPDFSSFWVRIRDDDALAGVFNLSQIFMGPFCNAYLSYYAFFPHAGRGYMSEGLRLVLRFAFLRLRLHRIEANLQPGNHASRVLVQRGGFQQEGFSRRYLKINGRWRDHERWALLREDWRAAK